MPSDHSIAVGSVLVAAGSAFFAGLAWWQNRRSAKANEDMALASRDMAGSNSSMAESNRSMAATNHVMATASEEANQIALTALEAANESNRLLSQSLEMQAEAFRDERVARIRMLNPGYTTNRDTLTIEMAFSNFGKHVARQVSATIYPNGESRPAGEHDIEPGTQLKGWQARLGRRQWEEESPSSFWVGVQFLDALGWHDLMLPVEVEGQFPATMKLHVPAHQVTGRRTPSMRESPWMTASDPEQTS
jgi:hypothetical protein